MHTTVYLVDVLLIKSGLAQLITVEYVLSLFFLQVVEARRWRQWLRNATTGSSEHCLSREFFDSGEDAREERRVEMAKGALFCSTAIAYRSFIGSLMYLVVGPRPDIANHILFCICLRSSEFSATSQVLVIYGFDSSCELSSPFDYFHYIFVRLFVLLQLVFGLR